MPSRTRGELDPAFPEWGMSPYFRVTLRATCRLRDLLTHLYVLVPVLDDNKHYFVGDDEVALSSFATARVGLGRTRPASSSPSAT
jgi:hypothetical protein